MIDTLFPSAEVLDTIVGFIGQYSFWGVGIAFVGWLLGYVLWFVIDALRY